MNARRSERMSTTMPNTTMSTTIDHDAAKGLREVEARRETAQSRLKAARGELADLSARATAARDGYRAALAQADLEGRARPSRDELTTLQDLTPAIEDRVAGLERALGDIEREWCEAKAAALEARAAEVRRATAWHQAELNRLAREIDALAQQATEHEDAIRNDGPVAAMKLDAEAAKLRRQR
jgi:chromosome segregation ATPase